MLRGIDISETVDFSLAGDTESPTIFVLRPLTQREKLRLIGPAISGTGQVDAAILMRENLIDIVLAGIKSIRNFRGEDCEQMTEEILDRLSLAQVGELAAKIIEMNFLSGEERKNSS